MTVLNEVAPAAKAPVKSGPAIPQSKQLNENDAFAALKAKRDAATAAKQDDELKADEGGEEAPEPPEAPTQPEAEGENDSDNGGDEETADKAEGDDEPGEERTVQVTVDGEVRYVPESELKQVYSSAKSLMKKQDAIVAHERAVKARLQEVNGLATRYVQQLGALEAHMRPALPSQQKLDELLRSATQGSTPQERADANSQYLLAKESIARWQSVQAEKQRVQQQAQQESEKQVRAYQKEQSDLLRKAAPDFNNPQYVEKTASYLRSVGFTDEDIGTVDNHLAWLVIDKARKWDERNENIGKGVRKALKGTKSLSPSGAAENQPKPDVNAKQRAASRANLQQTGSLANAMQHLKVLKQTRNGKTA